MFYVMVEIANYRQLSRLRSAEAGEVRGLLDHFSQNRGGRLLREQNGFFLFCFHPLREKVIDQVSDFLFLTSEALDKKEDELFGFSLLLDRDDLSDETTTFARMKSLVFLAPRPNRIWAGPGVRVSLAGRFPLGDEEPLAEVLGPPRKDELPPLSVGSLLEMTGWIEALSTPLSRQLAAPPGDRHGKVLRLKGTHLFEKYFVLKTVLEHLYGTREDFPVFFPLEESRDFLSQLLDQVDPARVAAGKRPADPAWESLLTSRGGGGYSGDSGAEDVAGALVHYFRTLVEHLESQGLPAVFVILLPKKYEPEAQKILETILAPLVANEGMRLLLLEPADRGPEFLGRLPSLSWTFPALSLDRLVKERDSRGWQDRFPVLDRAALEACGGRGMAWVHHLWSLQEGRPAGTPGADPSWSLLESLDSSHHKVYFILWASRGLLEEGQLADFFQEWGEDRAVIEDKIKSLGAMGFFLGALGRPLRPDFGPLLAEKLGDEGRELLSGLGTFLHRRWTTDHRLSEVLFRPLQDWGLPQLSLEVLNHYLTSKIHQGRGEFLPLLRPSLWATAPTEDLQDAYRLSAAAAKLRFALNRTDRPWHPGDLTRFQKAFTPRTESRTHGEWELQVGRYRLRTGDLTPGFTALKKALLEAQHREDRSLEIRAQTEIGLTLLRRHRTVEGREYFEIASRLAEKAGNTYLLTLTNALDATALFLLGHLSGAGQALERGIAAADRGGLRQWKVFLTFLRARLAFDLGDYSAALATLAEALAVARRYRFGPAIGVLGAWKGRALVYTGDGEAARAAFEGLEPSAENRYFLAEAAYFDREYEIAGRHLNRARDLLVRTQPFGAGEGISWLSGFAAVEDRCLTSEGDPGVLQNQIEGFSLLVQAALGDQEAAPGRFPEILARKALLDTDPVSAWFYYWYYLALPKHESHHEAQRLTLLGRSLKDFQVRSSRIEDPLLRQDYLSRPYWNAQAGLEAKKLKLL
jgi:hypothetical protein